MLTQTQSGDAERTVDFEAAAMFRRILVPIDFSEVSKRALATALELQRRFGSEVCLFHLTERAGNDDFLAGLGDIEAGGDLVEAAQARLKRFVENTFPGAASLVVCRAHVGTEITPGIDRATAEWKATLVVLGERPRHSLLRSRAEKIVQELTCPVILVRKCDEDQVDAPH